MLFNLHQVSKDAEGTGWNRIPPAPGGLRFCHPRHVRISRGAGESQAFRGLRHCCESQTRGPFWPRLALLGLPLALLATSAPAGEPDIRRDATVAAVEKVMPSVVNIATETIITLRDPFEDLLQQFFNPYRGQRQNSEVSLGSGVVIDEDGYVLTNDHVVRRANKIWVKVSTNDTPYEARLVASNPRSDVALVKIEAKPGEKFAAVRLAKDDDLLVGETVLALGNPFGLGGSVSRGILSSKSRVPPKEADQLDVPNWLQTDASINPGNSGGPLVNLRGELIGLNVAILAQAQGIGFAIPIKQVSEALSGILTPENSGQGIWFGARVQVGPPPLTIAYVQHGSPADQAGLKPGDTVLQINGRAPRSFVDLTQSLTTNADLVARLAIQRHGERRDISVRMMHESDFFNADLIEKRLGVRLQPLTPQLARGLRLNFSGGFIVADVDSGAPAAEVLHSENIITAMEGQTPPDLTAAAKLVYGKQKGEKVRVEYVEMVNRGVFWELRTHSATIPVR